MPLIWWYSLLGACIACYILGILHGKGKAHWRSVPVAAADGAWIDLYERHERA